MVNSTEHRIVVADALEIVRQTVSDHLTRQCGVNVVAQTKDGYETLKMCRHHRPDLVILDMSIARPAASDTMARLRSALPDLHIVVVTENTSVANAFVALSHGAVSILPRSASAEDYVNAVNAALSGHAFLPSNLMRELVSCRRTLMRSGNIFGLSARELEVLEACVGGASTKEVASSLDISVRTVETHRHNIYRKTSCNSVKELETLMSVI